MASLVCEVKEIDLINQFAEEGSQIILGNWKWFIKRCLAWLKLRCFLMLFKVF
jgi:hypothetical protein